MFEGGEPSYKTTAGSNETQKRTNPSSMTHTHTHTHTRAVEMISYELLYNIPGSAVVL